VLPGFGLGGMELRLVKIINGLGPGWRHTVLPLNGNHAAMRGASLAALVAIEPPPVSSNRLGQLWSLRKVMRRIRPDLLCTYNWGAMDAQICNHLGAIAPSVHNECGFDFSEATVRLRRRKVMRRVLLRRTYATVVVSRALEQIATLEFGLSPGKVHFIQTGVDSERFRPELDRSWRRIHGVPDSSLLLGFVGGLRKEKSLNLMLEAFSRANLRNSVLALVGAGSCHTELAELARELGIADRVVFAGHEADPAVVYPSLDLFLNSSATEQTPNALLEAMATGLPTVCTDVGDCAYLLGSNSAPVIVPYGDADAYAASLRELAASPGLRRALGEANRRRAVQHFPLDRMVAEYRRLYEAAIVQRAGGK